MQESEGFFFFKVIEQPISLVHVQGFQLSALTYHLQKAIFFGDSKIEPISFCISDEEISLIAPTAVTNTLPKMVDNAPLVFSKASWRAFKLKGTFLPSDCGVITKFTKFFALNQIAICCLSCSSSIFVLVPQDQFDLALQMLHTISHFRPEAVSDQQFPSKNQIKQDFVDYKPPNLSNATVYKLPFRLQIGTLKKSALKNEMHPLVKLMFFPSNKSRYFMVTITEEEITIVTEPQNLALFSENDFLDSEIHKDAVWTPIQLAEEDGFSQCGILDSFAEPLAKNGVPIFNLSTFHTDIALVKVEQEKSAIEILSSIFQLHEETEELLSK